MKTKATALKYLAIIPLFLSVLAICAQAASWAGGNGNWSSDGNPGWSGTGVPNAAAAIADFNTATTGATIQDIVGGVTVGTVSLTNNSPNSRTINLANAITFNQDGTGTGTAIISNTNTNASPANFLDIETTNAQTIRLADDLSISNTGGSTRAIGSILIGATISGVGNLTLSNVSNIVTNSTSYAGAIRIQTGTNTFTGTTLVQKGATTFNNSRSFGDANNVITIGQNGQGSATLASTTGLTLPNNIIVAAGSGGNLVLGSASVSGGGYSGTVTLNGNLSLASASTGDNKLTFSGTVSGVGSLTKIGAGSAALTASNTYAGGTTVAEGILLVNNNTGSGTGTGATLVNAGGTLGGRGTIDGTTVTVNGMLSPGDPATNGGIGRLTINDAVTLAANSVSSFQLLNNTAGNFDQVVSNNTISVSPDAMLSLTFQAGFTASLGQVFKLLDAGAGTISNFAGTSDGAIFQGTGAGAGFYFEYDYNGVSNVYGSLGDLSAFSLVVVPEPSRALLLLAGLCLLASRRRA